MREQAYTNNIKAIRSMPCHHVWSNRPLLIFLIEKAHGSLGCILRTLSGSPPNSTRFTAEKVLTSVRQHLPGSPNMFYCWRPCSLSNRCVNSRYLSRHKPLKLRCVISTVLLAPPSKTCDLQLGG